MSVTTSQVQDIQTTIASVLQAGSWALYGSQPTTYKQDKIKFARNIWIELKNTSRVIKYATNGTPILFDDKCDLEINVPNRTSIDKIYADILNIFFASGYTLKILREREIPLRGKYKKILTVKLIDI